MCAVVDSRDAGDKAVRGGVEQGGVYAVRYIHQVHTHIQISEAHHLRH